MQTIVVQENGNGLTVEFSEYESVVKVEFSEIIAPPPPPAGSAITDADFISNGVMRRISSGVYDTTSDNSANWNTAHGWGNHASAGYLTSAMAADFVTKTELASPTGELVADGGYF